MSMLNRTMTKSILGLALCLAATGALAASPVYVQIGSIKGDSRHPDHAEWIEVEAFSQSVSRPGSAL